MHALGIKQALALVAFLHAHTVTFVQNSTKQGQFHHLGPYLLFLQVKG